MRQNCQNGSGKEWVKGSEDSEKRLYWWRETAEDRNPPGGCGPQEDLKNILFSRVVRNVPVKVAHSIVKRSVAAPL